METNKLYKIADNQGITVDFADMPTVKSACLSVGGKKFIAIDKGVRSGSAEEKVKLAHEIGHCENESFYFLGEEEQARKTKEKRADMWAILNLVPLCELELAVRSGKEDISLLAEHFGVTEAFMQKALQYYCEKI